MSTLEIVLAIGWAGTLALLVRLYRKHLIARHLFIRSSDWCARKIDEMVDGASWEIQELAKTIAETRGHKLTDKETRDHVPFVILDAKKEWQEQADAFQSRLARNGMQRLDLGDLDTLVLFPGLGGVKP